MNLFFFFGFVTDNTKMVYGLQHNIINHNNFIQEDGWFCLVNCKSHVELFTKSLFENTSMAKFQRIWIKIFHNPLWHPNMMLIHFHLNRCDTNTPTYTTWNNVCCFFCMLPNPSKQTKTKHYNGCHDITKYQRNIVQFSHIKTIPNNNHYKSHYD